MKFGKGFGYTLGAVCLLIAIYFAIWSIANPDYAAEYPFIALILFVIGIVIILCNALNKDKEQESQSTEVESVNSMGNDLEETKITIEEKKLLNGIDVNKIPYKSKTVAILLCLFLGLLGIHRIYLGHTQSGIAMMAITICLRWTILVPIVLCILCLVDIVSIAKGDLKDIYNRPLV